MPTLADVLRQTGYSNDGELSAPTPIAPTMTSILQKHIATLPQQLAENQAKLDSTIGGWNKTDFGTGMPNPNYRPEALQEFAQLVPNMMGATAWHGTPHEIKGLFDIGKVGTGEGAQAYGHGMYFAENPAVAEGYQHTLGKSELSIGGKDLEGAQKAVADRLRNSTYEDTLNWINTNKKAFGKERTAEYKNALESIKGEKIEGRTGNLYKVDIPDEHIPNMLDWDKPLSKQSKTIQDALARIDKDLYHPSGSDYDPNELGQMIYSRIKAINSAKGSVEADKAASQMLDNLGIKGIRYLDEGSRSTGKGTSNFVVFDPSTVKILEKNGVPTRKEILEQQLNKVIE